MSPVTIQPTCRQCHGPMVVQARPDAQAPRTFRATCPRCGRVVHLELRATVRTPARTPAEVPS